MRAAQFALAQGPGPVDECLFARLIQRGWKSARPRLRPRPERRLPDAGDSLEHGSAGSRAARGEKIPAGGRTEEHGRRAFAPPLVEPRRQIIRTARLIGDDAMQFADGTQSLGGLDLLGLAETRGTGEPHDHGAGTL